MLSGLDGVRVVLVTWSQIAVRQVLVKDPSRDRPPKLRSVQSRVRAPLNRAAAPSGRCVPAPVRRCLWTCQS
jgi:hypothetical protein